jgi:rhodanese-related sulfurtransferase
MNANFTYFCGRKATGLCFFCCIISIFQFKNKLPTMDINVEELKARLDAGDKNFVFIDVREQYEYEDFNLGAKLIPLGDFTAAIPDLLPHKADEIVIHCRSGKRSGIAQQLLQQFGFSNVRNLEGGVLAWQATFS